MRLMIFAAVAMLAACQPSAPAPGAAPKQEAAPEKTQVQETLAVSVLKYVPSKSDPDGDAEFRGPMTFQETAAPEGQPPSKEKRYRFTWMDGKHVVVAVEAGKANGKAKIDGPLTLEKALGAPAGAAIDLLAVEIEDGPIEDPDYTPLCGIRPVMHIAMYRRENTITLATTSRNFGPEGGCSNTIAYDLAP